MVVLGSRGWNDAMDVGYHNFLLHPHVQMPSACSNVACFSWSVDRLHRHTVVSVSMVCCVESAVYPFIER